ncbi:radical SAM protein [Anditalea andensis]|uniref:Radical SAM protein n=1 Tax=Anditalea andensis TaxID=1048983 RepID=A0A074LPG8_9BACT|nr:radical SAM protein [Anditalea andensis]
MARPIFNITPFTLLDYPGKIACILWFAGCNMRCIYCYNPEIVMGKGKLFLDQAMVFIESRKHLIDGVVLSGGECTLHRDIIPLTRNIKDKGLDVKIDTNGALPERIDEMINQGLVDYIALDFKSLPKNFESITGSRLFDAFESTLQLLIQSKIAYEVRTTVHSDLISVDELKQMVKYLDTKGYKGKYYIQHFTNGKPTIGNINDGKPFKDLIQYSTKNIQIVERGF